MGGGALGGDRGHGRDGTGELTTVAYLILLGQYSVEETVKVKSMRFIIHTGLQDLYGIIHEANIMHYFQWFFSCPEQH